MGRKREGESRAVNSVDEPLEDFIDAPQILIVEDSQTQAEQLKEHLTTGGYGVTVARNGNEALAAALGSRPALVITDVIMPGMDGFTLCKEIKSQPSLKDVPVIVLTSLSGPQDVLRGLESGADNFIRKPYDDSYLLARVENILRNQDLRRRGGMQMAMELYFRSHKYSITAEKQQILDLLISTYEGALEINKELKVKQQELTHERDLLHTLMDNIPDFIYFKDTQSRFTTINRAHARVLHLSSPANAIGKTDFDYFSEQHAREALADEQEILRTGRPLVGKVELAELADGSSLWVSTTKMITRDINGNAIGTFGVSRDITDAKLAEQRIREAKDELEEQVAARTAQLAQAYKQLELELAARERAQEVERETQARFRFLFANNPFPTWVYDETTLRFLEVNDIAIAHYGYSYEEFANMRIPDIRPSEGLDTPLESAEKAFLTTQYSRGCRHRLKDGRTIDVEITSHRLDWRGRKAVLVVAQDVTDRKQMERALYTSESRFRTLTEAVPNILMELAIDGSVTFASSRLYQYRGLPSERLIGANWTSLLHSDDIARTETLWKEAVSTGQPFEAECRLRRHDGVFCWFVARSIPMYDHAGEITHWLASLTDVDRLKRTETALRYSNDELHQFAYAAAHDLQEPLRNVVNSAGLLGQLYNSQLDEAGKRLIAGCIEDAQRMHCMIKDLLAYTKVVDDSERASISTDCTKMLQVALSNLNAMIAETQAEIQCGPLPVVIAEETHVLQLFQNLIGNALKYRKPDIAPLIRISASDHGDEWEFAVADNGIGFDPRYAERIFGLFKRLHRRQDYSGNGIGLALCVRIITHYGGRIWADAQPGVGATFRFTLPMQRSTVGSP
jgi:PAS domain S-box-containing protein